MPNVKRKLSKDALNARAYGIARDNAKLVIGQITKPNATKRQNNFNSFKKKRKIWRKQSSSLIWLMSWIDYK